MTKDRAQEHARARNSWRKAEKAKLAAEKKLSIADVAALMPAAEEPPPAPQTRVVRLVRGNAALQPIPQNTEEDQADGERRMLQALRQMHSAGGGAHLRIVEDETEAAD